MAEQYVYRDRSLSHTFQPLRPFTILPSTSSSERSRLRAEVFRPDHRLPTMTIDEYLEEENRRGNIISGGGHVLVNISTFPTSHLRFTAHNLIKD